MALASGVDTLIAAPTGSGKTLAGFLVAINALYRAHEAGESVSDIAKVVYVSPLKALAVDIAENLDRPLDEIAAVAAELGLGAPGHPGGRTHGRHHQFAAQPRGCAGHPASSSPRRSPCTSWSRAPGVARRYARSRR